MISIPAANIDWGERDGNITIGRVVSAELWNLPKSARIEVIGMKHRIHFKKMSATHFSSCGAKVLGLGIIRIELI